MPNIFYFAPVPILVVATSWQLLRLLTGGSSGKIPHAGPFLLALFLLFLGYSGLAISLWPNIIPPGVSFRDAAAPAQSQGFALVGALLIIPVILAYTGWAYYVFRGKVTGERGLPLMWAAGACSGWSRSGRRSVLALGVAALAMRGLMSLAGLTG